MPEIPYIRWRWSAWTAGRISRRPAIEQALFVNLQAAMCQAGGPVAVGRPQLIDLADRLRVTVAQVVEALANLVEMELVMQLDDAYMIQFLADEFEKVARVSEVRQQAGRTGGRPKTAEENGEKQMLAIGFPTEQKGAKQPHSGIFHEDARENKGQQMPPTAKQGKPIAFHSPTNAPESEAKKPSLIEKEKEKEINTPQTPGDGVCAFSADGKPSGQKAVAVFNTIVGGMVVPCDAFRRYMAAHPKKTHHNRAAVAWNAAIQTGHDPEAIIAGLATSPRITAASTPAHVVNPEQFLLDCCWLDQPAAKPASAAAPTPEPARFGF